MPFNPRPQSLSYEECEAIWQRRQDERRATIAAQERERRNPHRKKPAAAPEVWKTGFIEDPDPIPETGIGGGNWLVEKLDLPKDALSMLKAMRSLGYRLQDRHYDDLHRELRALIDPKTGKWLYFGVNPETQLLFEQIEEMSAALRSDRKALARAIVEFDITGTSFLAVYEDLKRTLNEYRKFMGQKLSKTVPPGH
jgi:hypothetical protein